MTPSAPPEIVYRLRERIHSHMAGAHPSAALGGYGRFHDQTTFLRHPDARRIDLRASLRDPFEDIHVRRFAERRAADVYAVVDLSASMAVAGACVKIELARTVALALAWSAPGVGDRFGLIGCAERERSPVFQPATRARAVALRAADSLRAELCAGRAADGFVATAGLLGQRRSLVFLISDFRWPPGLVESVLGRYAAHDVVAVVLVDSEEENPPDWGLMALADSESGERRLVFMRPALRRRWAEREQERQARLAFLAGRGRPPIFLRDRFDPADFSRRLLAV
ncbi:MxaS protein [Rhodoblastus sphagnicola]|uniref:MxaS protein n=1 Tax=Rhodoblastus sphagnicola TaxID=333368 RepID=A0A2S6NED6_9HYPH|nr:DUF58 domain-containing protein [Rhodoblastus sphagnicola]MBB4200159.1 uncharacterized protein (DUF58 family) [Rhodoblastus sphagnicola]PPQ33015.1 MxaS protein [Rhodoblastus sphagnicola]